MNLLFNNNKLVNILINEYFNLNKKSKKILNNKFITHINLYNFFNLDLTKILLINIKNYNYNILKKQMFFVKKRKELLIN
jgi:hypothetical protein